MDAIQVSGNSREPDESGPLARPPDDAGLFDQNSPAELDPGLLRMRLSGRILVDGEIETVCRLNRVEGREGSFTLSTSASGPFGPAGRAVAYLEFVGRIEGPITRTAADQITMVITAPESKWARLRRQLVILSRMPASDQDELRSHRRIAIDLPDIDVLLPNGLSVPGRVRDLSRSGAAVETAARAAVGDRVTLGTTRGHVARTIAGGFAVQFVRLLPFECFGSTIRL